VTQGDGLEIALWAKNLLQKKYAVIAIAQPQNASDVPTFIANVAAGDDRNFFLTATYSF